jgi:hypothetical protein
VQHGVTGFIGGVTGTVMAVTAKGSLGNASIFETGE